MEIDKELHLFTQKKMETRKKIASHSACSLIFEFISKNIKSIVRMENAAEKYRAAILAICMYEHKIRIDRKL